jgi:hypothetical protein
MKFIYLNSKTGSGIKNIGLHCSALYMNLFRSSKEKGVETESQVWRHFTNPS